MLQSLVILWRSAMHPNGQLVTRHHSLHSTYLSLDPSPDLRSVTSHPRNFVNFREGWKERVVLREWGLKLSPADRLGARLIFTRMLEQKAKLKVCGKFSFAESLARLFSWIDFRYINLRACRWPSLRRIVGFWLHFLGQFLGSLG